MILRELVRTCSHSSVFNILYKEYYKNQSEDNLINYSILYREVCDELLNKLKNPNSDLKLYITEKDEEDFTDPFFPKKVVDICLYNEKLDELLPMDFVLWSEIVDCEIYESIKISESEILAHILYEITTYGFTESQIISSKIDLESKSEKFNNLKIIKWEDINKNIDI
jgi:hypothetical protein